MYGYPRVEDEKHIVNEGRFAFNPNVRLFLYVVLYRPTNETQTLYTRVYNPVVVYHALGPECLSQRNGLNWVVKQGDLLGAFIPNECTTAEDLISRDDVDTFRQNELMGLEFCPAQINLNNSAQCFHALYLNTSEGIPLDEIESIDYEKIVNVSTKLNILVTTKKGEGVKKTCILWYIT